MESSQVVSFYNDLGKLVNKYNLRGLCGICFDDEENFMPVLFDPRDFETRAKIEELLELLRPLFAKFSDSGTTETRIGASGLTTDDGAENN